MPGLEDALKSLDPEKLRLFGEIAGKLAAASSKEENATEAFSDNSIGSCDEGRRKGRFMNVYGPYKEELRTGNRWKVIIREKGKKQVTRNFENEEEAKSCVSQENKRAVSLNVPSFSECLEMYREYLTQKGNKPRTIATTIERMTLVFRTVLDQPISRFTPVTAARVSEALRFYRTKLGKPIADDTRLNTINQARTFGNWCRRRGHVKSDPFENVEVIGKRRKGKKQLRIDEARKYEAKARELADLGDIGAVIALVPLYLGTRSSEAVKRRVRDLDDQGRILWVEETKTEAGTRRLEIPPILRPYLLRLAKGKEPSDFLFSGRTKSAKNEIQNLKDPNSWIRRHVKRMCRLGGVPIVTTHGVRGTHSTLAIQAGATGHAVALAMGHTSQTMTFGHYVKPDAATDARNRRVEGVLTGLPVETDRLEVVSNPGLG